MMKLPLALATIGVLVSGFAAAHAQPFPAQTIRIINGPSPDTIPRLFADRLNKKWNSPVIVEPRPGAGGEIAAKAVASAEPDGYTLLFATSSFTLNTALGLAGYNFQSDFDPVALAGVYPFVLIVNKDLPANNVQELIALAKQKPGELNCGSAGQGTAPHLACELFNRIADVKTVHVPFREANSAMSALLGGHVQMSFAVSTAARSQIQGGAVRALGLTAAHANNLFPGVPTLSEAGLPGFELRGWAGFVAPAKTPAAVLGTLNAEIMNQLAQPDVKESLARIGTEAAAANTPAQLKTFIVDDIDRWNKIVDTGQISRGRPQTK